MNTVCREFHPLPDHAFLSAPHAAPNAYLSMAVVMSVTASLDWLANLLGGDSRTISHKADTLYRSGKAFESPVCGPWLSGIRTPHNRPLARGLLDGISLATDASMLCWSIFEGVAFQFRECLDTQLAAGIAAENVVLVGGGSSSTLWSTIIATLLGRTIELPTGRHLAACLGAARLAQLGADGADSPLDILARRLPAELVIEPDVSMESALQDRFMRYKKLLEFAPDS